MGVLTFPLVISVLKPHKPQSFSFLLCPVRNFRFRPVNRRSFASSSAGASTVQQTFSENGDPSSVPNKSSVPSFQQAIQRLQVWSEVKFFEIWLILQSSVKGWKWDKSEIWTDDFVHIVFMPGCTLHCDIVYLNLINPENPFLVLHFRESTK